MIKSILVPVERQGLHDITERICGLVESEKLSQGLCTLFIQHTSASLLIQENYDPSARDDLEAWLNRLVPERDPLYTHTLEGPDDMPAHIKTAITATSLSIPVVDNSLALGAWQGIFLWEHRKRRGVRKLVVHLCT
jgi:secondary thiamine-phosphate synthase enzyme